MVAKLGQMFDGESAENSERAEAGMNWVLVMGLLVATVVANACTVSDTGLAPVGDAGSGCGAKGTAVCPTGLTSQASWPSGTCYSA